MCDHKFKNQDEEGVMLICGHVFHHKCFAEKDNRCNYCSEFYRKGVIFNVNSYKKRLEKNDNVSNSLSDDEILNDVNGDCYDEYEYMSTK